MGWYQPQPFNISEEMRKKQKAGTLAAKALELRKQANAVKAALAEVTKKYKVADDKATKAEAEATKAEKEAAEATKAGKEAAEATKAGKTTTPEGDSGGEGKE